MLAVGAAKLWTAVQTRDEALRLRRVPLFAAAVAFALGEVCSLRWQWIAAPPYAAALLLLLTFVALWRAPRLAMLPALALMAALGCWCAAMQPAVHHSTDIEAYADGLSRSVEARVIAVRPLASSAAQHVSAADDALPFWQQDPGAWQADDGTAGVSLDLEVLRAENVTPDVATMKAVSGTLRVTVLEGPHAVTAPEFYCGETLQMPLRLRVPDTFRTPGAFSMATLLGRQGIDVQSSVRAGKVAVLPIAAQPSWACRVSSLQHRASARLDEIAHLLAQHDSPAFARLQPADVAMLDAMLFGDRTHLTQPLRAGFERTGTFHLFVVSGLHVALLAALLFWLLEKLHTPIALNTLLTIALTAGYALFSGFGLPVQRALLMTAVYLVARWRMRSMMSLQALGIAALTVLVLDPRALFSASFQMTCLVVLAFAGLAAPLLGSTLERWVFAVKTLDEPYYDLTMQPRYAQARVMLRMYSTALGEAFGKWLRPMPRWLLLLALRLEELIVASLFVEAVMALPMAIYFHRATLFALPANLLLLPALPVLAVLAVVTFALALVYVPLALLPAAGTASLLHAMDAVVAHFAHLQRSDLRVPSPAMAFVVAALMMMAVAFVLLQWNRRWSLVAGVLAALAVPILTLWPVPARLHHGLLEVTALDVGQGDSLLVVSPDGHTMLVDGGGPVGMAARSPHGFDTGEDVVAPYLWSRHIRRLDDVLLTHGHSDHMGGLPAVLRDLRPRELWISVIPGDSADFQALLKEAAQLGITVRSFHAGETFDWHGVAASVLAPEIGYSNPGAPVNNDSLVMRLDFDRAGVLLEGDAERPEEDTMLAEGRLDDVTLLKVGHHGSHTSTNPEFLNAIQPREAVISVGRHNTFGHPRADVLKRLAAAHVQTWRTDREGTVTFLLAADGRISATQDGSN
jgi:competence protein ComEC